MTLVPAERRGFNRFRVREKRRVADARIAGDESLPHRKTYGALKLEDDLAEIRSFAGVSDTCAIVGGQAVQGSETVAILLPAVRTKVPRMANDDEIRRISARIER